MPELKGLLLHASQCTDDILSHCILLSGENKVTTAIWVLLSSSTFLSPLVTGQAPVVNCATRVDSKLPNRNNIMQTDRGREERHKAPTKQSA